MKKTNRQCVIRNTNKESLKEGIAQDIMAPAKEILSLLDKVDIPDMPYDDLIQGVELDVSEDDLDQETGSESGGSLEEKVINKLTEAVNQTVADFLSTNPENKGYKAYTQFCDDTGVKAISSAAFLQARKKYEDGGADASAYEKSSEPKEPSKPVELSAGLQSLVNACSAGADYVETAADTVNAKYKMIGMKLKRVILGKSLKNYYLLMGDAGIGKSYIVKDCLTKCGKDPKSVPLIKGDIGSSRTDVAKFLWKYKDEELVILDDCDTTIQSKNPAVQNMLKGAMDPDGHAVTISPTILKELTKSLQQEAIEAKYGKNNKLFEARDIDDEDDEWLDDEEGGVEGEGLLDTDVPTETWTFNARVVFVSNLDEKDVTKAVLSRCDYYTLHLTQEEYLIRLGKIIKDMDINSPNSGWTDERVDDAKAMAVAMMANVIEAANKGVKLFNKTVRLTHPLEFRIVRDLVEGYLMLVDDYIEENPGATEEEAGDAIIPEFVRTILMPRL